MGCAKCDELKYDIHHQTNPDVLQCWWIQCPNCGHEGPHATTYEDAVYRWKCEC